MANGLGIKLILLNLIFLFKECVLQTSFSTYVSINISSDIRIIIKSFAPTETKHENHYFFTKLFLKSGIFPLKAKFMYRECICQSIHTTNLKTVVAIGYCFAHHGDPCQL